MVEVLTLGAVATGTLLPIASVLLWLATISCLRSVLALAVLLPPTILALRSTMLLWATMLLLAAVTAVLLSGRR